MRSITVYPKGYTYETRETLPRKDVKTPAESFDAAIKMGKGSEIWLWGPVGGVVLARFLYIGLSDPQEKQ